MSDRLEWFGITVPPATPIASPVTVPMVFLQGEVVEIDVKILDGPCGTVGFFITAGGSQYVPRTQGNYIVPNDDYFTWPMQNAINSGSWGLTAYNLDSWPHLIQVAFQVNEIGTPSAVAAANASSSIDTLTAALSQTQPSVSGLPDGLSLDSLLNSLPSDITPPSPDVPLDTTSLQLGAVGGTS